MPCADSQCVCNTGIHRPPDEGLEPIETEPEIYLREILIVMASILALIGSVAAMYVIVELGL